MASFLSLPYEDIKAFLTANNEAIPADKNAAYELVWDLIMNKPGVISPSTSIVDFIIAYNLGVQGAQIPVFNVSSILIASDEQLMEITHTFGLQEVDRERIMRILENLGKLNNDIELFNNMSDEELMGLMNQMDPKSYALLCGMSHKAETLCYNKQHAKGKEIKPIMVNHPTNILEVQRQEFKTHGILVLDKLAMIYRTHPNADNTILPLVYIERAPNAKQLREYLLMDAFQNGYEVVKPAKYDTVYKKIFGQQRYIIRPERVITKSEKLGENDYDLTIEYEMTDALAQDFAMTVPYKTVIIKYSDPKYWRKMPKEKWYAAKTRPYVIVNKPFMQVTVSAKIKGSPITLEDIVFATKPLALNQYRTLNDGNGYKILSENEDTLIIEPSIDNEEA